MNQADHNSFASVASAEVRLALGPVTIDVRSDDEAALDWLSEFLEPAFTVQAQGPAPADHVVTFERAPVEHTRMRSKVADAAPDAWDVFTVDGSFARYRGWKDDSQWRWVHDRHADVFHGTDASARSVRVVATGDDALPRGALMRAVRELATGALLRNDHLPVHAAAFAHNERAILVCGPKRSGKSSLLLHALRCGASFISNDRLFVTMKGDPIARAMPTIVRLRDGSLAFFEDVAKAMAEARFDRCRTIAECAPGRPRPAPHSRTGEPRRGMSPAQLCQLVGAEMLPGAPAAMLLFPRIDPAADGIVIERLAEERASEAMGRSLLKASHPTRVSEFFSRETARDVVTEELEAHRCRELAKRVPAYECRLGPNAFQMDLGAALSALER